MERICNILFEVILNGFKMKKIYLSVVSNPSIVILMALLLNCNQWFNDTGVNQSTIPGIPKELTAVAKTSWSISVRWCKVNGSTAYRIYRSSSAEGNYSYTATVIDTSYQNIGLDGGTPYFYKVSAVNQAGETEMSNYVTATTLNTVKDIEGNVYQTAMIGTKLWMAENLKTTKYNDGTPIPLIHLYGQYSIDTVPAYCWYNNDSTNKAIYGALYTWYTVNTGKLAPTGWHVATDTEWTTLITQLGGGDSAGGKLKETGTEHWDSPNIGATNETGFTAIPGGYVDDKIQFNSIGYFGIWWSSTATTSYVAWRYLMSKDFKYVLRDELYMLLGYSVRCVKD
jgi:uncharacterized protein (TIGR02145 family)